jgi:hypothetical protein
MLKSIVALIMGEELPKMTIEPLLKSNKQNGRRPYLSQKWR